MILIIENKPGFAEKKVRKTSKLMAALPEFHQKATNFLTVERLLKVKCSRLN